MISKKGYNIVIDENLADVIIVNTCGFIESAKKESINTLLEMSKLKENGVCKAVIAVGCLAQRYKNDIIEQIPEIDEVVSLKDYELLGDIIDKYAQNEKTTSDNVLNHNNRVLTTPYYTAYIKISEGCNNRCTYCVIPSIRGSYVSRPVESIIEEAKVLTQKGVQEIILIAQDTTSYCKDLYGESN
jgi:ribosomal protein S12 methylthiotransferase